MMPEKMYRDDVDQGFGPDGTVIVSNSVRRDVRGLWEPLQIKGLFTTEEWTLAKSVATDTFESLTLTFQPIAATTVVEHLRGLIGSVLTSQRFEEITGRSA